MSRTSFVDAFFNILFFLLVAACSSISCTAASRGRTEAGLVVVYVPDGDRRDYMVELHRRGKQAKAATRPTDVVIARFDQAGRPIDDLPRTEAAAGNSKFAFAQSFQKKSLQL